MAPIRRDNFGEGITRVTMTNSLGSVFQVITFGARIHSWKVQDARGKWVDVVLGYDTPQAFLGYKSDRFWIGSTVGRVSNRIRDGRFTLNEVEYALDRNEDPIDTPGPNYLNGGFSGFSQQIWTIQCTDEEANTVTLAYDSQDGEGGFPGNVHVELEFHLSNENQLRLKYTATTDQATPIMLNNHGYYNLTGEGSRTINDHEMYVFASKYLPIDDDHMATGEIASVTNTNYDFRTPKIFGKIPPEKRILDACYVLSATNDHELRHAARVCSHSTGLQMDIWTDQPGLLVYTASYLNVQSGKGNKPYHKHSAFSLETQGYPDAVNNPNFPSCILQPDDTYEHTSIYKIGVIGPVQ